MNDDKRLGDLEKSMKDLANAIVKLADAAEERGRGLDPRKEAKDLAKAVLQRHK
jgi:hypothetical protein